MVAGILAAGGSHLALLEKYSPLFFGIGGVLFGVAASMCLNYIQKANLLTEWMEKRAEAETQRLHYFDLITRPQSEGGKSALFPALIKLEYFRRFQLDVQIIYYQLRGSGHSSRAKRAVLLGTLTMGLGALANGLAGGLGFISSKWTAIAGLALVAQAFAALIGISEAINQDGRNAERYDRTGRGLRALKANLDEVRLGLIKGKTELLSRFVEAVHEVLSTEHRQWLKAFHEKSSAMGRLEDLLNGLREKVEDRSHLAE